MDVLGVHAYTLELRLSYRMNDPVTGQPDPSAYVRIYRDARQAEVTHCYIGRHWQDVLGLHPSPKVMFGHRLRMNSFLNKWLDYLVGQGHGPHTLVPCRWKPGRRSHLSPSLDGCLARPLKFAFSFRWGYSSAGRALQWHCRGHRFDPD